VDLLDIPDHPRLQQAPAEAPRLEHPDIAIMELTPPQTAAPATRDGAPEALAQSGLAEPLSRAAESPARLDPQDAGAPDAAPALDAAADLAPCAAAQSLGPNGNCFAIVASLLSWSGARQACRDLGSGWDLASIRSATSNAFVASLPAGEAWIGAADQTREGIWRWVSDDAVFWRGSARGSSVDDAYSNWSAGEPNDNRNSDCARLVPEQNGAWADLECAEQRAAVCEGPPR
jgi:hypothetical protein